MDPFTYWTYASRLHNPQKVPNWPADLCWACGHATPPGLVVVGGVRGRRVVMHMPRQCGPR